MASRLLLPQNPVDHALTELHHMETQTIELIQSYSQIQEVKKQSVNTAKTAINNCFENLINTFKTQQNELLTTVDTIANNNININSTLSNLTSIINNQKQYLSQLDIKNTNNNKMDEIICNFNESKQLYNHCIESTQQQQLPNINVTINNNRFQEIIATLSKLIEIKNIDTVNINQSNIDNALNAKVYTDFESKIKDLQTKLERERERCKRLNKEMITKIEKYLTMGSDSNVRWYDTNCLSSRLYQNWEPVLLLYKNKKIIDSKGKYKKMPNKNYLFKIPKCKDLGEFHACILKLRNGYVKWIQSIGKQKDIYKNNDRRYYNDIERNNKQIDPEKFVIEYAQRNNLKLPRFLYTKNESKVGGDVEGKLSFCGEIFTASAKKKRVARLMCYRLAMNYVVK